MPPLQANAPKLPVLHSPYNLILPQGLVVRSVLPDGNVISSRHVSWGSSGRIDLPCPLQSVCQWHALPLHYVELALYVDDTAIIATSGNPTLHFSYLESSLNDFQRWLNEWWIASNVSKSTEIIFARAGRRFIQPRPVTHFVEPIQWVDTTRYLVVILDTRLTWSSPPIRSGRGLLKRWVCWVQCWIGRVISASWRPAVNNLAWLVLTFLNYCDGHRTHVLELLWRLRSWIVTQSIHKEGT